MLEWNYKTNKECSNGYEDVEYELKKYTYDLKGADNEK